MKSPAEPDAVQWQTLAHAYGSAVDVPDLIRALHQGDDTTVDEAVHELYGNIHHQGTVYSASAPAVPFLAHAARHIPGKRTDRGRLGRSRRSGATGSQRCWTSCSPPCLTSRTPAHSSIR